MRPEQRTTPGHTPTAYLDHGAQRVGLFCRAPDCRHPPFRRDGDQRSVPALLAAAADRDVHELRVHGLRYIPPPEKKPRFGQVHAAGGRARWAGKRRRE
jgi:hypothetical protein